MTEHTWQKMSAAVKMHKVFPSAREDFCVLQKIPDVEILLYIRFQRTDAPASCHFLLTHTHTQPNWICFGLCLDCLHIGYLISNPVPGAPGPVHFCAIFDQTCLFFIFPPNPLYRDHQYTAVCVTGSFIVAVKVALT